MTVCKDRNLCYLYIIVSMDDLQLHLLENMFDQKRITANPNSNPKA